MSALSLRPYLQMMGDTATKGVRSCCNTGDISLRKVLSSFSMPIFRKWQSLGGAGGRLGRVRGNQQELVRDGHTAVVQKYDHGSIVDLGNGMVSAGLGGGAGGGALLPETPYRLTLEKVTCNKKTEGEALEGDQDELWARFVFADGSANADGPALYVRDYHNDGVSSGTIDEAVSLVLYEGSLPEFFSLTLLAIEVDDNNDAAEIMSEYVTKLSQELGLWFTPGSDETETRLAFNLWANRIVAGVLMAFGDFWTKVITSLMGPAMEALLQGLQNWYKAELIGVATFPPLGEYIRKIASGELPDEEPAQQVTAFGYQSEYPLLMKSRYILDGDGTLLEERRFFGGESDADYSFTLRHWLGNSRHGVAPDRLIALAISSNYISIYNPNSGKSHFGRSENQLSFDSHWSEYGYFLERSVNGEPFVQIASLQGKSATNKINCTDIQLPEEETISYRVRAYNQSGFGPYSKAVVSALPVPNAPYGLSASRIPAGAGAVDIHVYWMDDSENNIGYYLERSRSGGEGTEVIWVAALDPSTRGANRIDRVSDSFPGEKIRYRVRSINEYGRGPYSEVLEISV